MSLCKVVVLSEIKTSEKNGRQYVNATFSPAIRTKTHFIEGQSIVEELPVWETKRAIWGPLEKDGKVIFKADSIFRTIELGKVYDVDNHTFPTTPFAIGDKKVNKFTALCFSNENPVDFINAKLKRSNAWVIGADKDGVEIPKPLWAIPTLTVDATKEVAVTVPAGEPTE